MSATRAGLTQALGLMTDIKAVLREISTKLATLEDLEGSFIEVRYNGSETILGGNRAGLLQIALQALALAENGKPGSHFHIDQNSLADVAECPLVIRMSPASEA